MEDEKLERDVKKASEEIESRKAELRQCCGPASGGFPFVVTAFSRDGQVLTRECWTLEVLPAVQGYREIAKESEITVRCSRCGKAFPAPW